MIALLRGALGLVGLTPAALALYGGIALAGALALAGIAAGIHHAGYASAEQKCDAAALRARVAELQTQLKNANDRAEQSARVVAELQAIDATNAEQIETLRGEIAKAKLQSTQPGAKRDANAFYDDRCNLTDRGARGMRGR